MGRLSVKDLISVADLDFWNKAKFVEEQSTEGVIYVHEDITLFKEYNRLHNAICYRDERQLPFNTEGLLYFLLFSDVVNEVRISERDSRGIKVIFPGDKKVAVIWVNGGNRYEFDISNILQAKEGNRPHKVLSEISRLVDCIDPMLLQGAISSVLLFSHGPGYEENLDISGVEFTCNLNCLNGQVLENGIVTGANRKRVTQLTYKDEMKQLIDWANKVPKTLFVTCGSLKFICYDMSYESVYINEDDFEVDRDTYNGTMYVSTYMECECKVTSLSYWNAYVEPWLHISKFLSDKPNHTMVKDALEFWNDVAVDYLERKVDSIDMENLYQTVLDVILSPKEWDDEIWTRVKF